MSRPDIAGGMPVLVIVLAYIAVLLVIALRADGPRAWRWSGRARAIGYALSLSVLCTSWTYFGAAGTAVRSGWDFLPNFLGPMIALTVLAPIWRRVAAATRRENVGSIADFLASRYGKSRPLGALIACVAIVGALPYIALQMLSLSKAAALLVGGDEPPVLVAPLIVAALAVLAILFGARQPTLTQHNRGLTQVVTLEALVKLAGLVTVAFVALRLILGGGGGAAPANWGHLSDWPRVDGTFILSTLLCAVTMFTLPRVFHLGFVTLGAPDDIRTGQWLFPLYMTIWAAAIVPIAIAGTVLHGGDPDLIVLRLPLAHANSAVATLALLGGFSAGAAMVMVEAIALSAMISNELILPAIARHGWSRSSGHDIGRTIVAVRRIAIVAVLALGYVYFRRMNAGADLSQLGFASLAASAQLAPALIGGVLWRRGHARGAFWGVIGGMAVWFLAVAAPQLELSRHGAFALGDPSSRSSFNVAIVGGLLLNVSLYVVVSLLSTTRLIDSIQANLFVGGDAGVTGSSGQALHGTVGDLRKLLLRFLGPTDATRGLRHLGRDYGRVLNDDEAISPPVARAAERMLAGAIGASSARNVIALALAGEEHGAADVGLILDEAASAVQFSRETLQAALDSLEQGVSVVDRDLRLVAWNQRYVELFGYRAQDVYIGKPLEELMSIVSARSGLTADQAKARADQRLAPIRQGEPRVDEREWPDGRILRVVGRQLSTGEYVSSFSDVTAMRRATRTLARVNEDLEERVVLRTRELVDANAALGEAKELAERVMAAQDRFISAASHDLMQPMHAARLYLGAALGGEASARSRQLMTRADLSIEAADRLLKALLNLARVEVGRIAPDIAPVDLQALLAALGVEFQPIAAERGLCLHLAPTDAWGLSNADLLRSALQNLIGNAIRYTREGRVFVGVRRERGDLRIEVRDSGPGIARHDRTRIFREFTRIEGVGADHPGSGLGLAIAERICAALGHRLTLRSEPGRGSVFAIVLPRAAARPVDAPPGKVAPLERLSVLCVEDQADVLEAELALLEQWGASTRSAHNAEDALAQDGPFDVVLTDHHLGAGLNGLDLLRSLARRVPVRVLVTADATDRLYEEATRENITVLRKPLSPAALRSLLLHAGQMRTGAVEAR